MTGLGGGHAVGCAVVRGAPPEEIGVARDEASAGIRLHWGATSAGGARGANEDAYLAEPPVFLVADGMGGHRDGRQASTRVVAAFSAFAGREWLAVEDIRAAIDQASERIQELADGRRRPGSTLAGVALTKQDDLACWLVFNIGDSRVYRLAGERVEQITVDHSHVQELVDSGELSPEDARVHGERNIVTRALGAGMPGAPRVDQWLLMVEPGERLMICTDGLSGILTDQLIAATLIVADDPQDACDRLVRTALAAGSRDNVTAVVVEVVGPSRSGDIPGRGGDEMAPEVDLDSPTAPPSRGTLGGSS